MAAELFENGIATCATRALVTEFLAAVFGIATLERATTTAGADVLSFEILKRPARG